MGSRGSKLNNAIGVAGELRVMSELLLRGYKPAKSYLEDGADIILSTGVRVEVKSAHKCDTKRQSLYTFSFKGGGRKRLQDLSKCDFIICWCIDDGWFLIVPIKELVHGSVCIGINLLTPKSKYYKYKDNWDLLIREGMGIARP